MTTTWPRTLTEDERAMILADQIERFAWEGWRPINRTLTSTQLTRPKRISVGAAIFWALLALLPLLLYLLAYWARRDPVLRLSVNEQGIVRAEGEDAALPSLLGDWRCPTCAYTNSRQHVVCRRCGHHR